MTWPNPRVLKYPYRVYDGEDRELEKFQTEKQAREFAKQKAAKLVPSEEGSYNTCLVTHLYKDKETGTIYEDEVTSYTYKGKRRTQSISNFIKTI
jgi:hypothetical protein